MNILEKIQTKKIDINTFYDYLKTLEASFILYSVFKFINNNFQQ